MGSDEGGDWGGAPGRVGTLDQIPRATETQTNNHTPEEFTNFALGGVLLHMLLSFTVIQVIILFLFSALALDQGHLLSFRTKLFVGLLNVF